ncbi:hypothetical protein H4Q26_014079 [Puccinia striiformis f. sp. tritici PST-130]|nr:hypothetical protein H4Q26_014079 [Puccinia striiformis f. sp. tritici PST-130]
MSHLLLFTRSEFESPSYQQLRLQALLLTRKRRQPSPTHNTLAVTQEQLAAVQNRAHMPDVPTSEAQHKKPVRRQAKQVKTQFTKPVKTESILAKSGSIAIVPCKKPAIPVRGTCLKPADLQKGATAVGWQPAPLNSDDWDWIEANLAASRAREAEQAAIFKRDRIEANLASSDTRKAPESIAPYHRSTLVPESYYEHISRSQFTISSLPLSVHRNSFPTLFFKLHHLTSYRLSLLIRLSIPSHRFYLNPFLYIDSVIDPFSSISS